MENDHFTYNYQEKEKYIFYHGLAFLIKLTIG